MNIMNKGGKLVVQLHTYVINIVLNLKDNLYLKVVRRLIRKTPIYIHVLNYIMSLVHTKTSNRFEWYPALCAARSAYPFRRVSPV